MPSNKTVRVEQCDRNSAADFLERAGLLQSATHAHYTQGLMDGSSAVLAFARHRTLSQADGREEAEAKIARLNRDRTDRQYMIDALVPMLGPKGREVWAAWQAKGVVRQHTSWAIDPMTMAGEDVAQLHLDTAEAMKTAVLIEDFDGHLSPITEVHQEKSDG